jgi:hypothetical protein
MTTSKVLGVDLASGKWSDNGSALLELDRDRFTGLTAPAIVWPSRTLDPGAMAAAIDAFARAEGVCAVSLDGPQGWRDPGTPDGTPGVGRRCEYACRTQGKTGVRPVTFPSTQRPWIEFCIEVFDRLLALPDVSLANDPAHLMAPKTGYVLLECFPTSAWRSSGLDALPGKHKRPDPAPYVEALTQAYALPAPPKPVASHDDVQGVVAALCAVPFAGGPAIAEPSGSSARLIQDAGGAVRVEGLIWNVRPRGMSPVAGFTSLPRPRRKRTSRRAAPERSVRVTQFVLDQVARAGPNQAQIALRGFQGGTRDEPVIVELAVRERAYQIRVGDTYCAWRSSQDDATRADFESLFAMLADQPDVAEQVE